MQTMTTLELIEDAALFGCSIPEERLQEVRDYFKELRKPKQ